jgi:hypothetical protein
MRHLIGVVLAAAIALHVSPLKAALGQATASISGTAKATNGRTVPNSTVQLRNMTTNQLAGTATTNAAGQFTFAGLQPGTYAVEAVNAAGEIIGTSSAISVTAGAAITGVAVTATIATAAAAAAGLSTTALVAIIAAAGAAVTVVAVKLTGSSSQ